MADFSKLTPDLDNKVYPPLLQLQTLLSGGRVSITLLPGGDITLLPGVQDPGPWIQDPGSWARIWILDPGFWILDPGSRIRDPGSGIQDPGSRILDPGSRVQNPGCRIPAQLLYYPGGHYFITRGENPITLLPGGVYYPLLGLTSPLSHGEGRVVAAFD